MKILLSGATGFLGSALSKFWVDSGHQVTALLRRESLTKQARLEAMGLSVLVFDGLQALPELVSTTAPEAIVHTACSYGRAGESVPDIFNANVAFGVSLLDSAATLNNGCHFINTGTVLDKSTNYYSLTKWQFSEWGESVVSTFNNNLKFTNVLLQHMYGPDDAESKFTTYVLHSCQMNIPQLKLTHGEQVRDFIYVDDVVSAYDALLNNVSSLNAVEHVQVGSGVALQLKDFVHAAHQITRSSTQLLFGAVPYRPNEAMHCLADVSRMNELGWTPKYSLEVGLRTTIDSEAEHLANKV